MRVQKRARLIVLISITILTIINMLDYKIVYAEEDSPFVTSLLASDPTNNVFDLKEGAIVISDAVSGNLKIDYGTKSKVVSSSSMITITSTNIASNPIEITAVNSTVNLTLSDLNMLVIPKNSKARNAINLIDGTKVNLTVVGNNSVESRGDSKAAIHVPSNASLTIGGDGILNVKAAAYINPTTSSGFSSGAGIGGNSYRKEITGPNLILADSGTIIINSGTINAIGDEGAGIGAGTNGIARNITINGGTINAKSSLRGAGIGAGNLPLSETTNRTKNQYITINGGNVTAISMQQGAAIGGGQGSNGGYISITGGIVEVPLSTGANAIGAGEKPNPGGIDSFSTGGDGSGPGYGNAVILLSKRKDSGGGFISDMTNQQQWGGLIFIANEGRVYSTPNITKSFDIPAGYKLEIMEDEGFSSYSKINITLDGEILNKGTINGNSNFIINGEVQNFGTVSIIDKGMVTISPTGVVYNGSDLEKGKALIQNLNKAYVEVNGNIYNYSKIENDESSTITGSGNIYNLSTVSVEITKDGQPINFLNPIHYGDQITIKAKVEPGPYVNLPQWSSMPIEVQYKLWNGDTETNLSDVKTVSRKTDGTAEITQTIVIQRTDIIPWEGEKELEVGVSVNQVGGLQGYLANSNSESILYDKVSIDMSKVKWSKGDFIYDGSEKNVQITNLPISVTATYVDDRNTEPGIYKSIATLIYDTSNYKLDNMTTSFNKSLTDGYSWKINKIPVMISSWPKATDIIEGQALSQSSLTEGKASVPGSFVWGNPEQLLVWKEDEQFQNADVEFNPLDNNHYEIASGKVAVKVNPIFYKVNLDVKGGAIVGGNILNVQKGMLIPPPPSPTYKETAFAGWYKDADYSQLWDFDTEKVTNDMVLYAKYTEIDPVMLVSIPSEIKIVNNLSKETGEGQGMVNAKALTDSNISYPDKTLTITTESNVILTGVKTEAHLKVKVYDENDHPYSGTNPLMSFNFKESSLMQEGKKFSLKTPIDFNNFADTYQGVLKFQLELK